MNIILGASGQIGSLIVDHLKNSGEPVRAVVRKPESQAGYLQLGVESVRADLFDLPSLRRAFQNGKTLFVLTPENPLSADIFSDTRQILGNIKEALADSGIQRLVGLSSFGAQHSAGTGNLALSYLLEHSFNDLALEQIYIRPAYYYSNWLGYLDSVRQSGVLPTFFPAELKIPMAAPTDVAAFIADIIKSNKFKNRTVELMGPSLYSSNDIADVFGKILHKKVVVDSIPETHWKEVILQFGATENFSNSMTEMTRAVIEGKAAASEPDRVMGLTTSFEQYLKEMIN